MFQLPRGSRLYTKIDPAQQWGWQEVLLNKIEFALRGLQWQNENEGKKKSQQTEKPKLFMPEFMVKVDPDAEPVAHDIDEMKALLAKPRV